jgi:hypothetical protein
MPRGRPTSQSTNQMINFYEHKDIQKLLPNYHNPGFVETQISIPARIGVIASSGGGKTQWLLNFLAKTNDTWGHIHVVYKTSEPLYEFLSDKLKGKNITFYTSLAKLPQPNDIGIKDKQQLIVFDDQVNEKNQEIVKEYCIRGRKIGKGVSVCYLSQSFFKIPKIVRLQFSHLILLKLSSNRDLNLILSDYSLGVDRQQLAMIYKDATKIKFDFLKVAIDEPDNNKKFSHNWTDFYKIEQSNSDSDS